MDDLLVAFMRKKRLHVDDIEVLPDGKGWLLVELGGDTDDDAVEKGERLIRDFERDQAVDAKLVRDKGQQKRIWNVRESGLGATAYVPNHPDTWPGWEDSAVHRESLGAYLRELKALFARYGYNPSVYGHFGDGLVHCRVAFDLYSEPGIEQWRRFLDEAADLVVRYDGSLSGEHGDGQARAALLERMYGPELVQCFREFKSIWDPQGKMNPGKVIDPYPITSNLRVGPSYRPPDLSGWFAYADDHGSFARAVQRCVGVGKCRRTHTEDGVMCPSFMATREEKHSTRGRARLLFEMLHGGPIESGWRSAEVEEALSLCLACKGCKSDCPVEVDMATYKAEFNAHHYRWRLRPRAAYTMGRIADWARLASAAPTAANVVTGTPGLRSVAKALAGVAPSRSLPSFARQSFTTWFRQHHTAPGSGSRVLLWPDTFNNYFRPRTAIAATRVLETLGYSVILPKQHFCCGRPLYDWGWIAKAKRLWSRTFAVLRDEIEAGTPLVGLEPACVAAFKDELPNLFPDDLLAKRLSAQTHYFPNFVLAHANGFEVKAATRGKALVQIHCHQHALLDPGAAPRLLGSLKVEHEVLPSGCCGMAGAFGFDAGKYDISMAIAERALFPQLREAADDVVILADGFSCREQIEQGTGRATLHMAEIVAQQLVTPVHSSR
jgi:Fe-S oxidoreductase